MPVNSNGYFTPVRIAFWIIMTVCLAALLWGVMSAYSAYPRGSDIGACILKQQILQQAVRSHQNTESLKPGDPLDWSKIIGPGLFLESKPVCPVHGESAYTYCPVIPEPGTLAAPCQDPEHRPADFRDW
jgi:hypothetical protein